MSFDSFSSPLSGTVPPTWLEDRESCIHVFRISTAMTNLRFRINFLNTQLQVQRNKIDLTRCMIGRCFGRVQLKKSSSMLRDSKKQKIIGFKFRRGLVKKKLWRWVELTNARSELYRINKLIFWEIASIFLDALIFHYSLSCVQLVHFTDKLDYGVIVFVHSIYPFMKAIGMTAKYDELENFVVTDAKNRRIPLFREEVSFLTLFLGNDMSTTFLQQILSGRLLLVVIVGAKR